MFGEFIANVDDTYSCNTQVYRVGGTCGSMLCDRFTSSLTSGSKTIPDGFTNWTKAIVYVYAIRVLSKSTFPVFFVIFNIYAFWWVGNFFVVVYYVRLIDIDWLPIDRDLISLSRFVQKPSQQHRNFRQLSTAPNSHTARILRDVVLAQYNISLLSHMVWLL